MAKFTGFQKVMYLQEIKFLIDMRADYYCIMELNILERHYFYTKIIRQFSTKVIVKVQFKVLPIYFYIHITVSLHHHPHTFCHLVKEVFTQ
jgi:hypothetical protein